MHDTTISVFFFMCTRRYHFFLLRLDFGLELLDNID